MAIQSQRKALWFGTEERMGWFATPNQGADSSPSGWAAGGTLLNGGGYEFASWGSHKTYTYEWPASSAPEVAQLMKSYRDGSFGRGLIYFIDPLAYTTNILPALWADPSMAVGGEGPSIVPGVEPEGVPTSGGGSNFLPTSSAYFSAVPAGDASDVARTVFIPIPEGFVLHMGAFYSGSAEICVSPVTSSGALQPAVPLTPLAPNATNIAPDTFTGGRGVRLWVRGPGDLTATALIARLVKVGATPGAVARITRGPWIGGQGHSGCRFQGAPTYVTNNPIAGGRIGFAATFREVGSWEYGI